MGRKTITSATTLGVASSTTRTSRRNAGTNLPSWKRRADMIISVQTTQKIQSGNCMNGRASSSVIGVTTDGTSNISFSICCKWRRKPVQNLPEARGSRKSWYKTRTASTSIAVRNLSSSAAAA
eukprot:CAMPEP_0181256302 /NCGR_PEP_ID=MMETSP1096-20121128/49634_1 /TAXON_ID=156174 ORGANISM="Chrysochromulina ericina, Strain CCMP281" /NCGR_SAMPLE_ID=MMETSP1096 /ASSEMBLY_ACC=CAM_ASM_000453 /LENGTH=122 /DNA_ID=CAMNT_0023354535 /DNA_START=2013 /DNA_END=2381 /DNA_ORIENTATION=+